MSGIRNNIKKYFEFFSKVYELNYSDGCDKNEIFTMEF